MEAALQCNHDDRRYERRDKRYTDLANILAERTVLGCTALHDRVAWLVTLLSNSVVCRILTRFSASAAEVLRANVETLVLIRYTLAWLDTCIPASGVPALAIRKHHWPLVLLQPRRTLATRTNNTHVLGLAEVVQLGIWIVASSCSAELHLRGTESFLALF